MTRRAAPSTALASPVQSPVAGLSAEEWDVLKNSICKGFTDIEAKVFAYRCQALGLSPMAGQITAFKQGGGVIPIVTIDGYRSIAASIDPGYVVEIEYLAADGWVDWIPDEPASQCRARVWRSNAQRPVTKAVSRREFAGRGGPWQNMPNHMLAKVAESHALRMAYPQMLSGTIAPEEVTQQPQQPVTDLTPAAPPLLKTPPAATVLVTDDQLGTIQAAMDKRLSAVGRVACEASICEALGIKHLGELPAERFDDVMRGLADAGKVQRWNEGRNSHTGEIILSEEQIRQLTNAEQLAAEAEQMALDAEEV